MNKLLFMFMLSYSLILGCTTVESRWHAAQQMDSTSGYQAFVNEYPNSPYTSAARDKITEKRLQLEEKQKQLKKNLKKSFDAWKYYDASLGPIMEALNAIDLTAEEMRKFFGPPDDTKTQYGRVYWTWRAITAPNTKKSITLRVPHFHR
jgi:hypothetical protein